LGPSSSAGTGTSSAVRFTVLGSGPIDLEHLSRYSDDELVALEVEDCWYSEGAAHHVMRVLRGQVPEHPVLRLPGTIEGP
jgi:hypothetical protein